MNNHNLHIIKINYDKVNKENFKNFTFYDKWINDNISLLKYSSLSNTNIKIRFLTFKYQHLNPFDQIEKNIILNYLKNDTGIIKKNNLKKENEKLFFSNNLLYYKLINLTSMYFWELNQKYNIIQKNYKNLYEICNIETISDSIILINDKYFPTKNLYINSIILSFLSLPNLFNVLFEEIIAANKKNFKKVNFYNIDSFKNYEKHLDNIYNIDFIYLTFIPNSLMLPKIIMIAISKLFELYTFLKIINKINVGGSICIYIYQLRNINHLKLMAFYCSFFELYYITYPDIQDYFNFDCFYLILKNKKNVKFDPTDLLNELLTNSPSLGINYKIYTNENEIKHINDNTLPLISQKEYFEEYDEKIIDKISFINPEVEKIYLELEKEYINMFNDFGFKHAKKLEKFRDLYDKQENDTLTEEIVKEIDKQNIKDCIKWAKTNNFPLVPEYNIDHFDLSYENIMYRDVVSFEKDIFFRFKPYDNKEPNIKFTSLDNFSDLPPSFEKMIGKSREDIRAFDYRNTDIYKSIKKKIDYYYKKITYAISFTYDIPNFHVSNDEWLKIIEILSKIKAIDITKTNLKSFHICEFSGSFINAIFFYLSLKNKNIKWVWKAQRINPLAALPKYNDNFITNDLDVIHNEDIGYDEIMLNNYYDNYDFGSNNTGDITKYENIMYYRQNHNDYDLITVGCSSKTGNEHILSYSQYLMIFSCCKKGGNAILKRVFPIENSQELNMLYLFYCLFENVIVYKPKLNYHSQEYFLVALNYKGISSELLDKLIDFLKNFDLVGFTTTMPTNFTLQVDKMQNDLIENMNKFIKKQIYFYDNYDTIKKDEWKILKRAIKEKIKDFFDDIGALLFYAF